MCSNFMDVDPPLTSVGFTVDDSPPQLVDNFVDCGPVRLSVVHLQWWASGEEKDVEVSKRDPVRALLAPAPGHTGQGVFEFIPEGFRVVWAFN